MKLFIGLLTFGLLFAQNANIVSLTALESYETKQAYDNYQKAQDKWIETVNNLKNTYNISVHDVEFDRDFKVMLPKQPVFINQWQPVTGDITKITLTNNQQLTY